MEKQQLENTKKAGKIAKQVVAYAKEFIKPNMKLLEIAEKIEAKTEELGGKSAFPVNLAMNETAAHFTPASDSDEKANGLLKVDIGVHIKGCIADTAFSLDLTPDKKYKELIEASENALEDAIKKLEKNPETTLGEIGKTVQNAIEKKGFSPIINLSGHSMEEYELHSGTTIPNYDNNSNTKLNEGVYAIEPFATTGEGKIYEGGKSSIYRLEHSGGIRDPHAREVYDYINEEYRTLPFCERWISKKFPRAKISLIFLEKAGIIHHYPQLIEQSDSPVSQAEHTVIKNDDKIIVTTR